MPLIKEERYRDSKVKEKGTYFWFLHGRNLDVLPFSSDGCRFGFGREFQSQIALEDG